MKTIEQELGAIVGETLDEHLGPEASGEETRELQLAVATSLDDALEEAFYGMTPGALEEILQTMPLGVGLADINSSNTDTPN